VRDTRRKAADLPDGASELFSRQALNDRMKLKRFVKSVFRSKHVRVSETSLEAPGARNHACFEAAGQRIARAFWPSEVMANGFASAAKNGTFEQRGVLATFTCPEPKPT
jgi:hypothetical protein